jgi:hypothetical protein
MDWIAAHDRSFNTGSLHKKRAARMSGRPAILFRLNAKA